MMVILGLQSNASAMESGNNEVHLSRAPLVTTLLETWFFQNESKFLIRSPADRALIYAWGRFC